MPTYTINGKKVTTAQPLTDDQIDEIANELGGAAAANLTPRERAINQIPADGNPPAPASDPVDSASQRMWNNFQTGAMAVPFLATAVRGGQIAAKGTQAAPYLANAAKALIPNSGRTLAAEGVIGGVSGVAGGEIGNQVAQKYGETYRPLGELFGGVAGGLAGNTLVNTLPMAGKGALNMVMGGKEVTEAAKILGNYKASTKLNDAMKANPSLATDLNRATEITDLTGVKLPILAASNGDTTLAGLAASETSRSENAAFIALLDKQEKDALAAVKAAQKSYAASKGSVDSYAALQAAKASAENAKRQTAFAKQQSRRQEQLDKLDARIVDLSQNAFGANSGKEEIGNGLKNLLEVREQQLKAEFKPLYGEVLQGAKDQGIELESGQVAALHNWVKTSRSEDVFADFPGLFTKMNRMLTPTKTPVSGKFAEKYPNLVKTQEGTYKPLDVDDIDSLKREINKSIGAATDDTQKRRLIALREQFNKSLDTLPEEFTTAYRGLDNSYARKIGLPFSEAGVVTVDRSRFVEGTVPLLTEKPSAVRQIMAAVDNSPEAALLVEEAFVMRIAETSGILNRNTMEVNPNALNAFLKKRKEVLDQVPGLEEKLRAVSTDVGKLQQARATLLEKQKTAQVELLENVWTKAYGSSGGFTGFVNSSLKNPAQMNELIQMAGTSKTLQAGLKSSVLDIGLSSTKKMEFFTENAKTLDTLFGPEYTSRVKALLEASEKLAANPNRFKINQSTSQTTDFQRATGSKPEQIASEIRNPILGKVRAAMNASSRFLQNNSTKSESEAIQQFLSDPKAVADAAALMDDLQRTGGTMTKKGLAFAKKLGGRASSAALYGGMAPVITGELGLSEREPVRVREEEYAE